MIELLIGFSGFFLGFIAGQEYRSKAPFGYCPRCQERLKETDDTICAVCAEAEMLDQGFEPWTSSM